MVDPCTGEILICRDGGTTIISGTEVVSVLPNYCVMDVDPQTGRRFATFGREVAVFVGNQAVLNIALPYTVVALRYNPRNGLLYVVTSKSGYPPSRELTVIQGNTVVYTTSLGAYGGHPEVHPDSGLMYVPDGGLVRVLSGTQLLASLPVSSPVLGVVYHPFLHLVYAWGGSGDGEVAVINGTGVQARIPITAPIMVAPDPNRDYAYVSDEYGQITVISPTGVIRVLQVSSFPSRNPIDVVPGSGEIVVGVVPSKEVRIFPPQLTDPAVISTQVPPFAVRAHPSGRIYVVERDSSYPAPDPQTGLLVL
ncbi:MAG: YncE family protein, partial [Anaerolineae bacterium]